MATIDYGTVTYEGKTYTLAQQAYADNYGTDGGVAYYASAIDAEGNGYRVTWHLTPEYEAAAARVQAAYSDGNEPDGRDLSLVEDESNACDWETPYDVSEA